MSMIQTIPIKRNELTVHVLPNGTIHKINYQGKMINQLRGTALDGQVSNIYLRLHTDQGYQSYPLLGANPEFTTSYHKNQVQYQGSVPGLSFALTLHVLPTMWFYTLDVSNNDTHPITFDVFYVQDIGIKHEGAIRNNEAYNSQYIDHKVFPTKQGYAVCSLQNAGNKEYLQIGSMTPTEGFATDGYQFFGLESKITDVPEALWKDNLPNEIYQFEFACASLKSAVINLPPQESTHVAFYGYYKDYHPDVITELEYQDEIQVAYRHLTPMKLDQATILSYDIHHNLRDVYSSPSFDYEEIVRRYPNRTQEEYIDNQLVSFFAPDGRHIVLQEKERHVERSHGHIILNGDNLNAIEDTFSSTSYIYGLFQSQVVLGNTSFHRFLSNARNGLNRAKTSGQRIMIKVDDTYRLLTMPAVYEMGFNYAKWFYILKDDVLVITSYMAYEGNQLRLDIQSEQNKSYQVVLLHQVVMGGEEFGNDFVMTRHDNHMTFHLPKKGMQYEKCPNLRYDLILDADAVTVTNEQFFQTPASYEAQVVVLAEGAHITETIVASLDDAEPSPTIQSQEYEYQQFLRYYDNIVQGFYLTLPDDNPQQDQIDQLNLLVRWYAHDALIHYASPHGLEQFGGAAWGTRDVCQGPFEFFLANRQYGIIRKLLLRVFSHQHLETGNWPQWFMFDRYQHIQAGDAHGDIIVWPMRSLAMYLNATGDHSILSEKLSYTTKTNNSFTDWKESLYDHVKREISYIENHLLNDTHLSQYGDGDWDDTLQPANSSLRSNMVSGWTTVLTYEAMTMLSKALAESDPSFATYLQSFASQIKTDYETYVIKDGVPAGFLYVDEQETRYIIHPRDNTTNMTYRLLPMNRGIISEMFSPKQANLSYEIIQTHLKHPDGVRLMNRTVPYQGGKNTYFKRAETSACFGREIGLQYVHAHIRYIEAMAKMGHKQDAWNGLFEINPIQIQTHVKNAMPRQANAYFSSSDAHFLTRYQAMEQFDLLQTGDIPVKGGWRVYSSGPGIYMNQLIGNVLGLREDAQRLVLDPQLPTELNGLTLHTVYRGHPLTIRYHLHETNQTIPSIHLNNEPCSFTTLPSTYRSGGARLDVVIESGDNPIEIDVYTI